MLNVMVIGNSNLMKPGVDEQKVKSGVEASSK